MSLQSICVAPALLDNTQVAETQHAGDFYHFRQIKRLAIHHDIEADKSPSTRIGSPREVGCARRESPCSSDHLRDRTGAYSPAPAATMLTPPGSRKLLRP